MGMHMWQVRASGKMQGSSNFGQSAKEIVWWFQQPAIEAYRLIACAGDKDRLLHVSQHVQMRSLLGELEVGGLCLATQALARLSRRPLLH